MVCLPAVVGAVHVKALPVPLHVTTPVASSTSASELPGSHTVGGNCGTQTVPCSSVNGPHLASPMVTPAGSHTPSCSMVPSAHSSALHPDAASVDASKLERMIWFRIGTLLEVNVV